MANNDKRLCSCGNSAFILKDDFIICSTCHTPYPQGVIYLYAHVWNRQKFRQKHSDKQLIKEAAVLFNGVVYPGKRHCDCFRAMVAAGLDAKACNTAVQGFITLSNDFVTREDAAKIAYSTGQIKEPKTMLFSEDLY